MKRKRLQRIARKKLRRAARKWGLCPYCTTVDVTTAEQLGDACPLCGRVCHIGGLNFNPIGITFAWQHTALSRLKEALDAHGL